MYLCTTFWFISFVSIISPKSTRANVILLTYILEIQKNVCNKSALCTRK